MLLVGRDAVHAARVAPGASNRTRSAASTTEPCCSGRPSSRSWTCSPRCSPGSSAEVERVAPERPSTVVAHPSGGLGAAPARPDRRGGGACWTGSARAGTRGGRRLPRAGGGQQPVRRRERRRRAGAGRRARGRVRPRRRHVRRDRPAPPDRRRVRRARARAASTTPAASTSTRRSWRRSVRRLGRPASGACGNGWPRPPPRPTARPPQLWDVDVRTAKETLSRRRPNAGARCRSSTPTRPLGREQLSSRRPRRWSTGRSSATRAVVRQAAGLNRPYVARVFLVGGASRMPLVATLLHASARAGRRSSPSSRRWWSPRAACTPIRHRRRRFRRRRKRFRHHRKRFRRRRKRFRRRRSAS